MHPGYQRLSDAAPRAATPASATPASATPASATPANATAQAAARPDAPARPFAGYHWAALPPRAAPPPPAAAWPVSDSWDARGEAYGGGAAAKEDVPLPPHRARDASPPSYSAVLAAACPSWPLPPLAAGGVDESAVWLDWMDTASPAAPAAGEPPPPAYAVCDPSPLLSRLDTLLSSGAKLENDELKELERLVAAGGHDLDAPVPGRVQGTGADARALTRRDALLLLQAKQGRTLLVGASKAALRGPGGAGAGGGGRAGISLRDAVAALDFPAILVHLRAHGGAGVQQAAPGDDAFDSLAALVAYVAAGHDIEGYGRLPQECRYPYAGNLKPPGWFRRAPPIPHGFGQFTDLAGVPGARYVGYVADRLPDGPGRIVIPGWGALDAEFTRGSPPGEASLGMDEQAGVFRYRSGATYTPLSDGRYSFRHANGAEWRGRINSTGHPQEETWTPAPAGADVDDFEAAPAPIAGHMPRDRCAPTVEEIIALGKLVPRHRTGYGTAFWRTGADNNQVVDVTLWPSGAIRYFHYCADGRAIDDKDSWSSNVFVYCDLAVTRGRTRIGFQEAEAETIRAFGEPTRSIFTPEKPRHVDQAYVDADAKKKGAADKL